MQDFIIFLNILLIYTQKNIYSITNLYEILVLIFCSWLLYASITSYFFQSVKNDYIY